jgi:hypothetical protein
MNAQQARQTIGEAFRQKFDDARFLYFIRNLVNRLDESKKQTWTLKKAAFEDYVNHFTRLGTYSDPGGEKVDVLVIHCASSEQERVIARLVEYLLWLHREVLGNENVADGEGGT